MHAVVQIQFAGDTVVAINEKDDRLKTIILLNTLNSIPSSPLINLLFLR